jgi:hypothetical protein
MILSNGRLVPELTRSADIQLNKLIPLRSRQDDLASGYRTIVPKSGSTPAKPSGDHIQSGGFVLERASMANYRIVMIDNAGKLSRHRSFVCDNADDAIVWAKHSVDDAPVELWSGARYVARLEPRSSTKA